MISDEIINLIKIKKEEKIYNYGKSGQSCWKLKQEVFLFFCNDIKNYIINFIPFNFIKIKN